MSGQVVLETANLLRQKGHAQYTGEEVTQLEHALQTAWAAERQGAGDAMIAAALVHDVGHLLCDLPDDCADHDVDSHHEAVGFAWLQERFDPTLARTVLLHVEAKRYLCHAEAGYLSSLSAASIKSLALQGGPFEAPEAARFIARAGARAAVVLRRLDDQAKVPGLQTPDLEHFLPYLAARAL